MEKSWSQSMSKAPLLSQLTHLYLRKKHNHFHGCCAAKIFLVVMSKGFNVLFVYNKTILETSSEILSNMVKSSTFSTNHNRSYTLLTLVQRMLENLREIFQNFFL